MPPPICDELLLQKMERINQDARRQIIEHASKFGRLSKTKGGVSQLFPTKALTVAYLLLPSYRCLLHQSFHRLLPDCQSLTAALPYRRPCHRSCRRPFAMSYYGRRWNESIKMLDSKRGKLPDSAQVTKGGFSRLFPVKTKTIILSPLHTSSSHHTVVCSTKASTATSKRRLGTKARAASE